MTIYVECPHCGSLIEITQINCGIFRHGVFKQSKEQLNPHAPEKVCQKVFDDGLIDGCGKSFKLEENIKGYIAVKCPYI